MVEAAKKLTFDRIKQLQWGKIFHMYYIEPIVFVLVFAHSLSGTIMRDQVIHQTCTTIFGYNESDCIQLGKNNASDRANEIETEVQPYVANLFMIRTLLESIVPAICGVFIGAWSDHYGRKPLLLISMIGFSFTYVIAAFIAELSRYYVVNPWYYIIAVLPHSLLGGNCVFSVAAFCFISDITDTKTRPYRMIFMEAFFFIGLMGGSLLSSFVYDATGATTTFGISGFMMCAITVWIAVYVPESLHMKTDEPAAGDNDIAVVDIKGVDPCAPCTDTYAAVAVAKMQESEQPPKAPEQETDLGKAEKTKAEAEAEGKTDNDALEEKKKVAGLFSYVHIKDMLTTCLKPRPHYDRCIIWLVTGTMFLSIFVLDGGMTVFYLYVREKFHWTVRDFTFYETVSHVLPMFGALAGFLILRKVFSLSVVTLAILAFISDIASSIARGVAEEPWHMYLAVAFGAFRSVGGPMCRTIVSNIVPATDLGKIFSIKNVLQSIAPFLAAPLYTFIYKRSLTTFPGLFNIVSAALYTIALIFLIVVLRLKYTHREHYAVVLK